MAGVRLDPFLFTIEPVPLSGGERYVSEATFYQRTCSTPFIHPDKTGLEQHARIGHKTAVSRYFIRM